MLAAIQASESAAARSKAALPPPRPSPTITSGEPLLGGIASPAASTGGGSGGKQRRVSWHASPLGLAVVGRRGKDRGWSEELHPITEDDHHAEQGTGAGE